MLKKIMTVLLILGFVSVTLLFATSCTKKGGEESTSMTQPATPKPSPEVKTEAPKPEEKKPTPPSEGGPPGPRPSGAVAPVKTTAQMFAEMRAEFEGTNIYFDFDKSDLKVEARAILTEKAKFLREYSGFKLVIEGNCDERGTNEYNLALGERRANAAWKFLNALGISGDRMSIISYGEERPAVMGHNEAAWALNRRDEFRLK